MSDRLKITRQFTPTDLRQTSFTALQVNLKTPEKFM